MPARGRVARVLLDTPLPQLDRLLDYRIPEEAEAAAAPGVRVKAPLRSQGRQNEGFLVEIADESGFRGRLSPLTEVVSPARVLTRPVWELARRVADRSAGSASDVLRLAVPPRQVRVEKAWLEAGPASPPPPPEPVAVTGYPAGLVEGAVADGGRLALDAIPGTARRGGREVGRWALTLAEAAAHTLALGRSAILAVPDYRDQEQILAALDGLVAADRVARLDAGRPAGERYATFLACLEAVPRIVVGNRSAVYAPVAPLGLIALWDDGDPLFAEPLAPYAHARDVALVRQGAEGCALLLAAHSRSVEAQRLVEMSWLAEAAPAPAVRPRVVATARQDGVDERGAARIPSTAWRLAGEAVSDGPVLVQVARAGYAPVVACAECREPARCENCGGPLGLKEAGRVPDCGWCGSLAAHWRCRHCESSRLRLVTRGAGRTAEELGRAFPGARVIVADGAARLREAPDQGALVVATRGAEPVAPGGYRAVLLLDGERMLSRESLRVGEDSLRSWSNAAALAAPGAPVVLVGVDGPLARALTTWRQDRAASAELADRRALRFPPAVRVASVSGPPPAVERALAALERDAVLDVLGPTPLDEERVRALVRFEYSRGARVATALRSALVEDAAASSSRRSAVRGEASRGRRGPAGLRVRFDDPEIL